MRTEDSDMGNSYVDSRTSFLTPNVQVQPPRKRSAGTPCWAAELARIADAMRKPDLPPDKYCQLYVAQQALTWAFEPGTAAAPFDVVMSGKVQPLMGTQED